MDGPSPCRPPASSSFPEVGRILRIRFWTGPEICEISGLTPYDSNYSLQSPVHVEMFNPDISHTA